MLKLKIKSLSLLSLLATTPLMAMDVGFQSTVNIHAGRRAPTPSVDGLSDQGRTASPLPSESSFGPIDEDSKEQTLENILSYIRQNPTLVDELIKTIAELDYEMVERSVEDSSASHTEYTRTSPLPDPIRTTDSAEEGNPKKLSLDLLREMLENPDIVSNALLLEALKIAQQLVMEDELLYRKSNEELNSYAVVDAALVNQMAELEKGPHSPVKKSLRYYLSYLPYCHLKVRADAYRICEEHNTVACFDKSCSHTSRWEKKVTSQTNVDWKQLSQHVVMLSIAIALKATATI